MSGYMRAVVGVCVVAGAVLSAGCAKKGDSGGRTPESQKAITSLKDTRQELVRSKAEVNDAVAALDKIAAGGNLPQSYKQFTVAVKDVQAAGDRARARAQTMRANGRAYVARWEKEMDQVTSPELRAGAAERRQKVKDNYEEIVAAGRSVRDSYQPFLKSLQDIERALASDLTPAGVDAARAAIDKAKADSVVLNERLDAVIAELDEVSGGISGSAASAGGQPAPEQAPPAK